MKKLKGWQRDWLELVGTVRKDQEFYAALTHTARFYADAIEHRPKTLKECIKEQRDGERLHMEVLQ